MRGEEKDNAEAPSAQRDAENEIRASVRPKLAALEKMTDSASREMQVLEWVAGGVYSNEGQKRLPLAFRPARTSAKADGDYAR